MFKKALELRNAGLEPPKGPMPVEAKKPAPAVKPVYPAPVPVEADNKSKAAGVDDTVSGCEFVDADEPDNWWDK